MILIKTYHTYEKWIFFWPLIFEKTLLFLHKIPLEYANISWDNISLELVRKLENINIEAARIVSGLQDWHQLKDFFKK